MALTECPNCGKEISDKADTCVHCGAQVERAPEIKRCEECGAELVGDETVCKACGCPVGAEGEKEGTADNPPSSPGVPKKVWVIAAVVIVAVAVAIAGFLAYGYIEEQNEIKRVAEEKELYANRYEEVAYEMLNSAVVAEECGNLIKSVWANTIYEEKDENTDKFTRPNGKFNDDFNTSLSLLFADEDFTAKTSAVEAGKASVDALMKEMRNPPEGWEEAYDELKDYYDAYADLVSYAVDPSGSLTTYSEGFNKADTDAAQAFNKVKQFFE